MKKINGFSYKELFDLAISKPVLAQLELTQNCNQSCSFCFKNCSSDKHYKDLDISEWKVILKKILKLGVSKLNLTGGEPFLYKNFIDLSKFAKENGVEEIVVNTNGTIPLNKDILNWVDTLFFSVHNLSDKHDLIVNKKGAFDKIIENIDISKEAEKLVGINVVVTEDNIDNVWEIYNYFKKYNLDYYSFNLAGEINGNTVISEDLFNEYSNFLMSISEELKDKLYLRHGMQNIFINDSDFYFANIPMPHCAAGKYKLLVDYEGDVYPCSFFQSSKYYCGNLLKEDASDIWKNGKGFNFFRKLVFDKNNLPEKCENCMKKDKCLGGCLVWRNINKNNLYDRDIRCKIGDAYIRIGDNKQM